MPEKLASNIVTSVVESIGISVSIYRNCDIDILMLIERSPGTEYNKMGTLFRDLRRQFVSFT